MVQFSALGARRSMQRSFGWFLGVFVLVALCPSAHARSKKHGIAEAAKSIVNEVLVAAPVADEVCFAPDDPCDIKLVKFIQSAKTSLDIAIFDLNLDKLVHEILVQTKKIQVRILVDRRQAKSDHSLVPLLVKAGAKVKIGHQRGIMHNKFVIVDGKVLETGSFNYTNGAAFKNNENQVYLSTPAIVARYKARFEKIWSEGIAERLE
ncbi:phospholipase D-like domain-containing protein [Bdellovibrionota bacterium FG-2]